MSQQLTAQQASIIANALVQVRSDWKWTSLMTLLEAHRDHPATFPDLLIAAVTKAQEPDLRTPAAIFNPGPHWPEHVRDRLPAGPACADHPEEDAATCRCCRADVIAGDRPEAMVGKRLDPGKPVPHSARSAQQ